MSTFQAALQAENPLQIIGTINAYCAIMAEKTGYRAIYLSGAGCANASYGLPDLGMTSLDNVCDDVRRITSITHLPLLVDMDTGWGNELNVERSVSQLIKAGAKAAHIEDQVAAKRCGHRDNKMLVEIPEMVARLHAAIAGKKNADFYLIARTDAMASEGMDGVIKRAEAYVKAGAEAIFAEAFYTLKDYEIFCKHISVPVLANITEFGKTPLFTVAELKSAGVQFILYPLSAFRAMNHAALAVFQSIRKNGTQKNMIDQMQDRKTLYDFLDYESKEPRA
ncbi:MAG: methylisocitrate lyase [Gammaproteobacteria bacterium RIFCSPLOWO2_02_FULL_42_14]|nr:MAG: methylisocitrate lyase [Gammaproteobacteria bacterium RIFCSPHIGHO2_02_FULL_42_43]OGT29292.1 MAG: methylisocitrate lyase [Gammaproteobacteria bacterium RIFCSPHIGHO2_01_FULL_42_8]OGT50767.1 MAG: methylisocitrate lyase [Gammaproteobacteria bacterium RIFCSPHIGHO2_12_FULL_41_25]OGT61752.1 MAG: methylisocitrate lyase [Gammaproteobacteria bacterium RIFCSPLOWO2_02_FULL_42_14]OGT85496.1 MAG: methylisocitrate lyase [Gammaproteobacteria bacterium RIFCSPLOWO2_12_FULL_42_18]